MKRTHELVHFRMFEMPCCGYALCWVNPRYPNYCPECGAAVFRELRTNPAKTLKNDAEAILTLREATS